MSWLSKFRRTSLGYLTLMVLFYHGIGILIMFVGTFLLENAFIPDYEAPSRPAPLSFVSVLSAGPIEEILFFGIPFYASGNHLVVLAGGIVWTMLHVLNTNTLEISNLAYANWLFVIPSLFLSLRTWISGKGWFAIVTHSTWNTIFFILGCLVGEVSCLVNVGSDDFVSSSISSIVLSSTLAVFAYMLYTRKVKRNGEENTLSIH